jgi:ribosomal protein L21
MYLIICRQEWIRKERVQAFKTEKQEEEKRSFGFRHTLLPLHYW